MPIRINRVYTRTGDKGETHLVGGTVTQKDSLRVEAYGTVDELNAILGMARAFNEHDRGAEALAAATRLEAILKGLQNELFDLGSELATPQGITWDGMITIGDAEVEALETMIDSCQEDLESLESFILPTGAPVAAALHHARTVCRRAERDATRLSKQEELSPILLKYLNRLSDLLFVLARWISHHTGTPESYWEKGLRLGKTEGEPQAKRKRGE